MMARVSSVAWRWAGPRPLAVHWDRVLAVSLTGLAIIWGTLVMNASLNEIGRRIIGLDFGHYLDATHRWLQVGTPYLANEVAAPFQYSPLTFLHPPITLYLLLPFVVLPPPLWWLLPIGFVAWSVYSWQPAIWSWPIVGWAMATSHAPVVLIVGNSNLWIWAGVAGGLRFGWPALVTIVKPSLLPLALAGIRRRSFWVGSALLVVLSLPFGTLWGAWLSVIRNSPADWTYSLTDLSWLLTPVVFWFARTREPRGITVT